NKDENLASGLGERAQSGMGQAKAFLAYEPGWIWKIIEPDTGGGEWFGRGVVDDHQFEPAGGLDLISQRVKAAAQCFHARRVRAQTGGDHQRPLPGRVSRSRSSRAPRTAGGSRGTRRSTVCRAAAPMALRSSRRCQN